MAQFTLNSKDVMSCLISLANRLTDVLGWVDEQPREIKIEIPDDLWQHYGKDTPSNFFFSGPACPVAPRVNCTTRGGLPVERTEVELLLGVLTKKASQGTRRPKTRRA